MKLSIDIKAFENERVEALNTRKKPNIWESGKVTHIEIRVDHKKELYAVYRVKLDREPKSSSPKAIFIYVDEDKIKKL